MGGGSVTIIAEVQQVAEMQSGTHKAARPPLPTFFLFGSVMTPFPGPSTSNERHSWLFSLRLRCACSPTRMLTPVQRQIDPWGLTEQIIH